jgi:hypothetical protein
MSKRRDAFRGLATLARIHAPALDIKTIRIRNLCFSVPGCRCDNQPPLQYRHRHRNNPSSGRPPVAESFDGFESSLTASKGYKNAMKPMARNRPQKSKNGKPTAVDSASGAYRGYRCPGDRIRRRKISKGKFQHPPASSYPPDKTQPELRRLTSAPCAESNTSVDHYESHDKVRGPDRRTGRTGNTRFDSRFGSVIRASTDTDKRRL